MPGGSEDEYNDLSGSKDDEGSEGGGLLPEEDDGAAPRGDAGGVPPVVMPRLKRGRKKASSSSSSVAGISLACYDGDYSSVQRIVNLDPDLVYEIDDAGRSALHFAAFRSATK